MDDRDHNFNRIRMWGEEPLEATRITGDESYSSLFVVEDDFAVFEEKATETDRARFEFWLFYPERFTAEQIEQADLFLFAGRRFERHSAELKRQEPAHYHIIAIPIGEV